jgi:hypothetical protein
MRAFLVLSLFVLGCGSSESATTPADAAPPTGRATLRFTVNSSVRGSSRLTDPLKGRVHGAIYLAEDVNLGGPIEGAQQKAPVLLDVDLTKDGPSAEKIELPPLPENKYIFTGFLDVDGNGTTTERPDDGDPVTIPLKENQFDVVGNQSTDATITFNLVYGG